MTTNLGRGLALLLVLVSGAGFALDYNRLERPIAPSVAPITAAVERAGYRAAVADCARFRSCSEIRGDSAAYGAGLGAEANAAISGRAPASK